MTQPVSSFRLNVYMIVGTIFLHAGMMVVNEVFFRRTEFLQGIGWIYLPAGTRLLCTLLFGRAGMFGLLITGWFACYWYYFPGDAFRATTGTIAGALGPYLVYLIARREYGLHTSLTNLTPARLLACAAGCSVASPLLHHIWFSLHGDGHLLPGFLVMCIGDFAGTLIVLYTAKTILDIVGRRPATSDINGKLRSPRM
jgi:hypothetical protein